MMSDVADPVNIGNPHEMTIRAAGGAHHRAHRLQEPHRRCGRCRSTTRKVRQPDITRARTLLGWEPKVPLEEGLRPTLAYFRQKLGL